MSNLQVAFSGGKDSTAMIFKLKEMGEIFDIIFTPTYNELPELYLHIAKVSELLDQKIIILKNHSLKVLIEKQKMLPSWHSRWCTRLIKIEPCVRYLRSIENPVLAVGLRYDELTREGLYSDCVRYRYPLQELKMNKQDVIDYVEKLGLQIPVRTDCALCPYQRIGEWFRLWKFNNDLFMQGVIWEQMTQHTFRSPTSQKPRKDGTIKWGISLASLAKQFESGDTPRTLDENSEEKTKVCRVCSL